MVTLDLASPDPAVYDALPDGVLVADEDGRVLVLNAAAARMIGTNQSVIFLPEADLSFLEEPTDG